GGGARGGTGVAGGTTPPAGAGTVRTTWPTAIARTRAVSRASAVAYASTVADSAGTVADSPGTVANSSGTTRVEHLLTIPAAKVLARAAAGLDVGPGELLPHVGIVVLHAMTVHRIVLPVPGLDIDPAIDVDVVVVPVHSSAPQAPARRPAADRITGAERKAGRDDATGDPGRRRPGVGLIGGVRPRAVGGVG